MTRLFAPLARHFEDPADEPALAAGWQRIRDRRETPPYPWLVRGGLAFAMAAALSVLWLARDPGPLTASGGEELALALSPSADVKQIELSDSSFVRLAAGTKVVVGESSGSKLHLILREGEMDLDVRSKGRPTWTVDCGWVKVEITGTRLILRRSAGEVEVAVMEGRVRVSGEGLVPPVQYLSAGSRLRVPSGALPSLPSAPQKEAVMPSRRPRRTITDEAPSQTQVAAEPSADELLAQADAARRASRPKEAVAILERAEARAIGTKAALVAFTLGRVQLDDLGDAEAAALAFERALAGELPATLAESALARAVEARGRAGHVERARALAEEYMLRFPDGIHKESVSRWSKP